MSEKTQEFFNDLKARKDSILSDIEDANEMISFAKDAGLDTIDLENKLRSATREISKIDTALSKRI